MPTLKDEILAHFKRPRLAALATVTKDGLPWVRYMSVVADKDLTIRSATYSDSRKVKQIANNPEVHITSGIEKGKEMGTYFQIQGTAVFDKSAATRKAFWSDGLKAYFKGPTDPKYGVLVITPYKIEVMKHGAMKPAVWKAK